MGFSEQLDRTHSKTQLIDIYRQHVLHGPHASTTTDKAVPIKVNKNHPPLFTRQGKRLLFSSAWVVWISVCSIVKCLIRLCNFMEDRSHHGLSMKTLSSIVHQLASALTHLRTMGNSACTPQNWTVQLLRITSSRHLTKLLTWSGPSWAWFIRIDHMVAILCGWWMNTVRTFLVSCE